MSKWKLGCVTVFHQPTLLPKQLPLQMFIAMNQFIAMVWFKTPGFCCSNNTRFTPDLLWDIQLLPWVMEILYHYILVILV